MSNTVISAVASVLGMFLTGFFGYLAARNGSKKEVTINDRQLLSEDERHFRAELKEMMSSYQEQVKGLTVEISRLTRANLSLELQVQNLTTRNESLELQVHELTMANNRLSMELKGRSK